MSLNPAELISPADYDKHFSSQFAQMSDLASKYISQSAVSYINGMITMAFALAIKLWILDQLRSWYLLIFILSMIGGVYILAKTGYLDHMSWLTSKTTQASKMFNVMNQMSAPSDAVSFSVNDSNQSASIVYTKVGKKYIINIPYNSKFRGIMSQTKVFLITESSDKIDITQQPGVPYSCSAEQLGGISILAENIITGECRTFDKMEIPNLYKTS